MIAFEQIAKIALFFHAAAAIALIGSATHLAILGVKSLRGTKVLARHARLYALVVTCAFAAALILGLIVYPPFRVYVRADYLDANQPLLHVLFEVKEHLSGIVTCLLPLLWLLRPQKPKGRVILRPWFARAAVLVAVSVWVSTIVGLILVPVRSV